MKITNLLVKILSAFFVLSGILRLYISLPMYDIRYSLSKGVIEIESDRVSITSISATSPLQEHNVSVGDYVIGVNDSDVTTSQALAQELRNNTGKEVTLSIERNGEISKIQTIPRTQFPANEGPLGVTLSNKRIIKASTSGIILHYIGETIQGKDSISKITGKNLGPYRVAGSLLGLTMIVSGIGLLSKKEIFWKFSLGIVVLWLLIIIGRAFIAFQVPIILDLFFIGLVFFMLFKTKKLFQEKQNN